MSHTHADNPNNLHHAGTHLAYHRELLSVKRPLTAPRQSRKHIGYVVIRNNKTILNAQFQIVELICEIKHIPT